MLLTMGYTGLSAPIKGVSSRFLRLLIEALRSKQRRMRSRGFNHRDGGLKTMKD